MKPLRILAIGNFDPCSVSLGYRDALKAKGIDFRVASNLAFTKRQHAADWVAHEFMGAAITADGYRPTYKPLAFDRTSLLEFAWSADIIQIHPGLGPQWADDAAIFAPQHGMDDPAVPHLGLNWEPFLARKDVVRVAYFHGSTNTWANRRAYAQHYTKQGYVLATSTLDYAYEMTAAYVPPLVPMVPKQAVLCGDDDPLIVSHTPTNPKLASTHDFMELCRDLGIVVRFGTAKTRAEVLALKAGSYAGFDHLRGAFSINTVEHCATGQVALVGLKPEYRERLDHVGIQQPPWPGLTDIAGLRSALRTLRDDPALTRKLQRECQRWYVQHFSPEALTPLVEKFYRGLV